MPSPYTKKAQKQLNRGNLATFRAFGAGIHALSDSPRDACNKSSELGMPYVPRVEIVNRRLGRSNGKVSVLVVFPESGMNKNKRNGKRPVSPRAGRATRSLDPPDCQILQSEAPADLYNRLEGPYVTCRDPITFFASPRYTSSVYPLCTDYLFIPDDGNTTRTDTLPLLLPNRRLTISTLAGDIRHTLT